MLVLKISMFARFHSNAIPAEESPKRSRAERREVFIARDLAVLPFSRN